MTVAVETVNVSKSFGGVQAVREVSISFEPGYLYGLVGPNGAGKSTLVDLISGEQSVDSGKVLVEGMDVTDRPAHVRAHLGVGRTFQRTRLTSTMTVLETVMSSCLIAKQTSVLGYLIGAPRARSDHGSAWQDAWRLLTLLDLADDADRLVRELSWAEQRRLEIARALALNLRLLLLDEPTAGMHAESLPSMTKMLRQLANEGLAVVVIEHNVPFIRETVDRLYAMNFGALIAYGDPDKVLASEAVRKSYLGDVAR